MAEPKNVLTLHLKGQTHGGKNNMCITRTGRHYPNPKFVIWRDDMFRQIKEQFPLGIATINSKALKWGFKYTPQDNRRRDIPAILDAVFHVMERAFIVKDDCLIKNISFVELPANKESAGILIKAYE
jgi:Holliday junction resolvase RusA-like endonuclease